LRDAEQGVNLSDFDQLRRLRVAAVSGQLPADLGRWAVEFIGRELPRRRRERDQLLRKAASFISGSNWRKARVVHGLMAAITEATQLPECLPYDTPTRWILEAAHADPRTPLSFRQVLRLLADE